MKLNRTNTSEAVADHLLGEFVAGRLRPGDRIDPIAVADELGVSRAPVREALILLERDGTVRMPYHRGAFMGEVDAPVIREGFLLYGLLSGLTAQRAAATADAETLAALADAGARALAGRTGQEYERHAREFRRIVNLNGAGTHLRALLRTFNGLVLAVSKVAIEEDLAEERSLLEKELAAIGSGDAKAAAAAAIEHVSATGERGIAALTRLGVVEPEPGRARKRRRAEPASLETLVAAMAAGVTR